MTTEKHRLTRRRFLQGCKLTALGAALAALGGYAYSTRVEPTSLVVERVTVPLKGLNPSLEGFKIVQMGDFHLHPHTQIDLVQEAVALANSLKPDLVALTGDYVLERADSIYELAPILAQLDARYGVYSILGNHDLWTDARIVAAGLESAGIPLLVNKGLVVDVGAATIYVSGLDDGWSGKPDLDKALEGLPEGAPTLLLMHEPDFADEYALDSRVSLQLSGHNHGGQVRLPGLGALVLPRYAQKYDQGLYHLRDMWLYTNRGIGLIGPPLRFCCRPEVTEITLVGRD